MNLTSFQRIRRVIPGVLLLLGVLSSLGAQNMEQRFAQADSLSRLFLTHLSDTIYQSILELEDRPDLDTLQFRALLGLSSNRLDYFQFRPFSRYMDQAETIFRRKPMPPEHRARYHFLIGRASQNQGRLEEAEENLQRAEALYETLPNAWKEQVGVYLFHAQSQVRKNDLPRQKLFIDKAFAILLSKDPDPELLGDANLQLARYYRQHNQWESFLKHSLEAERNFREAFGDIHPKVAIAIQSQSHYYDQRGDLDAMRQVLERTQTMFDQLYPEHYARIGQNSGLLSNCYRLLQRFELAHEYIDIAIDRLTKHLRTDQVPIVADMYRRKAMIFEVQGSLPQALQYYHQSQEILATRPGNIRDRSRNYQGLTRCYLAQSDLEQAQQYNDLDFEMLTTNFGADNSMLSETYRLAGAIRVEQGRLREALAQYQLALEKAAPGFKALNWRDLPEAVQFEYIPPALPTLQAKASALSSLAQSATTNQLSYQQAAFETSLLAIELIDLLRSSYQTEETRQIIQETGSTIYQQATEAMIALSDLELDKNWADSIFQMVNKGKALLLREAFLDREARSFAGIPDSLLEKERALRTAISNLRYNNQQLSTPLTERQRNQELVLLETELDHYKTTIRTSFPKYYELKFEDEALGIAALQTKLSDRQAIIQYFFTDQYLVIAIVQSSGLQLKWFPRPERLPEHTTQFLRGLRDIDFVRQDKRTADRYLADSGYALYQALLKPALAMLSSSVKDCIIIPDNTLAMLPFEQLLSDQVNPRLPYQHWPWLLKSYNISYAYSGSMWLHRQKADAIRYRKPRVAAFAPGYNNTESDFEASFLAPLPYSAIEAKQILAGNQGDLWLDSLASESQFRRVAGEYDIYHLAMHGIIDNEAPLQSYLAFYPTQQETNDDQLSVAELYAFNLDAEMIVLSACNSGMGRLHGSEGMISLARAFTYSGASSIVMSRWPVVDQSTARLMTYFYRELKRGKPKDQALRLAKQAYWEEVDDPLFSHPYFWSSFVVIGDIKPIYQSAWPRWAWMPFAVLLAAFLWRVFYLRLR